ncbi:hypothetical protein CP981_06465 [Streptomyces platensis]|uniref:Uncharacterized protein n=1 Tax=Streptomyces platensis TaxID=58346 RepID=A0AAE6NEQ1_STRPT|nr:hypothetical protein CP981_06465 [Streptomyces platensis]
MLVPAPAGLVPGEEPVRRGGTAAPGTRGVGPCTGIWRMNLKLCSPHPRGWSRAAGTYPP